MDLERKHIDWIIVVLNKNVGLHLSAVESQVLDTSTLLFQLNFVLFDQWLSALPLPAFLCKT